MCGAGGGGGGGGDGGRGCSVHQNSGISNFPPQSLVEFKMYDIFKLQTLVVN